MESADATVTDFELNADPITATMITPSTISPIALRTVVIQLNDGYPTTDMTKEDFSVTIIPEELELSHLEINNDGVREFNVVAVDTDLKTVTIKYGGAYSGTYDVLIKSAVNGNIDSSAF